MKTLAILLLSALSCVAQIGGLRSPAFVGNLAPRGGAATNSLDDVTAYWKLDEASGNNRADSGPNGQTLTDSGTVAAATGKINNGADFEFTAETSTLTHADSATLSLGADTDFTLSAWVKIESLSAFREPIVDKCPDVITPGDGTEYVLEVEQNFNTFSLTVGNGSANAEVRATTFGVVPTGSFIFVVAWHDSSANTLNIQVNNGTVDSQAWSGGTQNGANAFSVGSSTANSQIRFDGVIDEVGFWKRILSSGERTTLYNSSSGITCCPFPP